MKKLIIGILCLFAVTSAQAQWGSGTGSKDFSFGPRAAFGVSNILTDGEAADWKFSFAVGGFANLRLAKGFYLHPELNFAMKGAKHITKVPIVGTEIVSTTSLSYIEIPVLAKLSMGSASILAGPYFGVLVASDYSISDNSTDLLKPDYETLDIGIAGGVEVTLPSNFTAEFRANYGFTEIIKDGKSKNLSLAIGIAYHL